jgi:hypothetical protein
MSDTASAGVREPVAASFQVLQNTLQNADPSSKIRQRFQCYMAGSAVSIVRTTDWQVHNEIARSRAAAMPLRSAIGGPAAEVRTFRVWPSLGHPRIYARRNHYEYRSRDDQGGKIVSEAERAFPATQHEAAKAIDLVGERVER